MTFDCLKTTRQQPDNFNIFSILSHNIGIATLLMRDTTQNVKMSGKWWRKLKKGIEEPIEAPHGRPSINIANLFNLAVRYIYLARINNFVLKTL